jgi:5-methyltetrahydrofolate--homocysteine methyltransferase
MGSSLIDLGLEPGAPPEEWNATRPDVVRGVHERYVRAGARVLTTNTFGATPGRMDGYRLGYSTAEINNAAVRLARKAAGTGGNGDVLVALSVGPTGRMLAPVGNADEDELEEQFAAQLDSVDEPVDVVLGETFFDIREAAAFLRAFRKTREERGDCAGITFTFNRTPRGFFTVMGNTVAEAVATAIGSGAVFTGANCTLTGGDMFDLARVMRNETEVPLLCQPNAGDPAIEGGRTVYRQEPDRFAADALRMVEIGINAVGGCCGTDPRFIERTAELLNERS